MPQNELKLIFVTDTSGAIVGIRNMSGEVVNFGKQATSSCAEANASFSSLTKGVAELTLGIVTLRNAAAAVSASFKFLGDIETATLAIGSAFMLNGKYIDQQTGKSLQAQQALAAAQQDARRMMEELQVANFQTIATLDQLVRAYQEALPVAMSKGFNREQVKEFTVAVVQAAGAIGLSLDQLQEETRSLLMGTINPRTSRIGVVLGLTNEDIKAHSKNAKELFDFLMGRLDAYRIAGVESQKTWAGLWSNIKDIGLQAGGKALEPVFEAIKRELTSITGKIVTIDETTKKINWNPEFLATAERFGSAVSGALKTLTEILHIAAQLAPAIQAVAGILPDINHLTEIIGIILMTKWLNSLNLAALTITHTDALLGTTVKTVGLLELAFGGVKATVASIGVLLKSWWPVLMALGAMKISDKMHEESDASALMRAQSKELTDSSGGILNISPQSISQMNAINGTMMTTKQILQGIKDGVLGVEEVWETTNLAGGMPQTVKKQLLNMKVDVETFKTWLEKGIPSTYIQDPPPPGEGDKHAKERYNALKAARAEYDRTMLGMEQSANKSELAIQKSNESAALAALDDQHKRGLLSEEDYYARKSQMLDESLRRDVAALKKNSEEEIARLKASKATLEKEYTDARPGIKAKDLALFDQKYVNDQAKLDEQIKKNSDSTQVAIVEATNKGNQQKTASDTEYFLRRQAAQTESMRFELDMNQRSIDIQLDARLDLYQQQEGMYTDLHDHMLMSDQEYFAKIQEINKQETAARIQALDEQFEAFKAERFEEIQMSGKSPKEKERLFRELQAGQQDHDAKIAQIERQGADRTVQIQRDTTAKSARIWDSFVQDVGSSLEEGMLGHFDKMGQRVLDSFKNLLAQLIHETAINPIQIQLREALGGGTAGPGLLGADLTPFAVGAMPAFQGNWAGALGGLAGAGAVSLIGAGEITSFIAEDILGGVSDAVFGAIGDIVPVLGPIIGIALGTLISGAFKGDANLNFGVGTVPGGKYQTGDKGGGWYGVQANRGDWAGGHMILDTDEIGDPRKWAQPLLDAFSEAGTTIKEVFSQLGLNTAGFDRQYWSENKWDIGGKSPEEVQAMLGDLFGKWITEASGVDFSQWSKNGEQLADTITRVVNAMAVMNDVLDLMDTYIQEVQGKYDGVAAFKDNLISAQENIDRIDKALKEATDPSDAEQYSLDEIKAIAAKYQAEKQMIEGLKAAIKSADAQIVQLEANLRASTREMFNWSLNLQQKIDSLRGTNISTQRIATFAGAGGELESQYNAATSPDERLAILNQAAGYVDTMLQTQIAQIQSGARSWTVNVPGNREIIEPMIEAAQKELDVIQAWKDLLGSVKQTIVDLTTSSANPADIFERMGIARAEADRLKVLYQGSTGEDRIKYAGQYSEALQKLLPLAQEAGNVSASWQRPGNEYGALFKYVTDELTGIQTDAESQSTKQEDIQKTIANLQSQIRDSSSYTADNSAEINAQIREANERAAGYYENIERMGKEQFLLKQEQDRAALAEAKAARETLNTQMMTITGGMDPDGWLAKKQKDAVDAMNGVKTWTETYWENFQAALSGAPATDVTVNVTVDQAGDSTADITTTTLQSQRDANPMYQQPYYGAAGAVFDRPTIFPGGAVFGEAGLEILAPRREIKAAVAEAMAEVSAPSAQPVVLSPIFNIEVKNASSDYDAERLGRSVYRGWLSEAKQSILTGDLGKAVEVRLNGGKVKH